MKWPTGSLSSVGKVVTGSTPRSSDTSAFGQDVPFVTPGDLDGQDPLTKTERYLTSAAATRSRLLPRESVLVSCIGNLGKIAFTGTEVVTNQQINAVIFDKEQVFPRFGFHACKLLKPQMETMAPATTLPIISKSKFEALEIPLPPPEEQRRIAAILDKAERLRSKRRAALALIDQLPQAIFLEMFGDPATNPRGWPMGIIRDLLSSAAYGTSQKAGSSGRWPILRMGNISADGRLLLDNLKYIDLEEEDVPKYTAMVGDILFNRTNSVDLVGKTSLYTLDMPMAIAGYLVRLRVNERAAPAYIASYMNLPFTKRILRSMAKSIVGMANINAQEVQRISIPCPPIDIQSEFAVQLKVVERARNQHVRALALAESLGLSFRHRAFWREF